jgi:aryl-alcohol dehydrogenase-like predicted oxidoreductase
MEASLKRLGRERVDVFQLHNPITAAGQPPAFTPEAILNEAVPALERLRAQGKCGWFGITGLGDAPALRRVLDEGGFATAQMPYNLLNPSGITQLPAGSPMPDLGGVIAHAASVDVGVMAIRVLAGGALSGSEARSSLGVPSPAPIASGADYAADVAAAQRFLPFGPHVVGCLPRFVHQPLMFGLDFILYLAQAFSALLLELFVPAEKRIAL